MADVLLARATGIEGFERHVVLKRIREDQARDARFVQMFLDEARLAASLHHHNIVQVHDIGTDDGEYFFAMEYVHGEDVRKLLAAISDKDQLVPIEHVVTIVLGAADALHYAHEHRSPDRKPLGIVHRDVSPANILVSYDGMVKVVDFGIAKATQRTTETQSGLMKGKVAYMSPEQCVGLPVDRRSDIFCLGIVLYELATARRLFKGANDFLTMSAITGGQIPKPSQFRKDIAPELEQIILKALAANPADRFQTALEMRAALEKLAIKLNLRTSTAALADFMRQVFGQRPVPWEIDEDDPDMELSIDFDGSASGLVPAPEAAIHSFVAPDAHQHSPIMRARTRAITGDHGPNKRQSGQVQAQVLKRAVTTGPIELVKRKEPLRDALDDDSVLDAPTSVHMGGGDPFADLSKPTPLPPDHPNDFTRDDRAAHESTEIVGKLVERQRKKWVIAGGVGAVVMLASVIAIVVMSGGDAPAASQSRQSKPRANAALPVEEAKPTPAPDTAGEPAATTTEPPAATEPPATTESPAATDDDRDKKKPVVKPVVVKKKPTTKPAKGGWDPNSLFPKK